jgi:hypothetical protein
MVSNQFIEMKSNAFKRFETNNLFQISCHDIRERFHYAVLLSIVLLRNMAELDWNQDHFWTLIPILCAVMSSELVVDWIKHAFILKFNNINSDVYKKYRRTLAKDVVTRRKNMALGDQLDAVSRRLGFIPMPLGCLVCRVVANSIHVSGFAELLLIGITYLCLMCLKIITSIILLGMACQYWIPEEESSKLHQAQSTKQTGTPLVTTKLPSSPFIQPQVATPSARTPNVPTTPLISEEPVGVADWHRGKSSLNLDEVERYTLVGGSIL